ncbi:STY4526/YPO1902 family pathogenicity island replication protein [Burkholderia gladioli]|uniref:STY4526/YPO1902 family pathogenicity island replication protein n=1 Tax=Burkholderia gladioli TaxID=28095 RepID=UPI00164047B9|nr:STY4526/YPO1902 family pathogenicity island replication protein [Burkholderia gladioli]
MTIAESNERKRAAGSRSSLRVELPPALNEMVMVAAIRSALGRAQTDADEETLSRLRATPMDQLAALLAFAPRTVSIEINLERLVYAMDQMACHPNGDEQLAYFIRNGATIALMMRVFKMTRRRLEKLHAALDLPSSTSTSTGRQSLPASTTRDAIHQTWGLLTGPLPARYIELHRNHPDWNLATLDQVLNEFSR